MDKGIFGALGDKQFWGDMARNAMDPQKIVDTLSGFGNSVIDTAMQPAHRASKVSQQVFPNQDWELSQRNALRHSAWIGGMAQAMGASPDNPIRTPLAQTAAKALGYAHEGFSAANDWFTGKPRGPEVKRDTLHDFNNNAIGAEMAGHTRNSEDLYRALAAMAVNARMGAPVSGFSLSDGRLSADAEASPRTKPIPFPTQG